MRIPVNLASQPFRRDRAVLVASGAVGVLLIALLAFLLSLNSLEERPSGGDPEGDRPVAGAGGDGLGATERARTPFYASPRMPRFWSAASS